MRKAIKAGGMGLLLIALVSVFVFFDPNQHPVFPRCPFLLLTGYQCPGCGSQRAFHDLLHLQAGKAFRENALLVAAIPYFLLGICLEYLGGKKHFPRLLPFFFGKRAAMILLILIFVFWIGRNIL